MTGQYYPDKIHVKTQLVSQEKNKKLELYLPGGICHLCRDEREELQHYGCNSALKCGGYCEECQLDMQALEKCGCEKTALSMSC